MTPVLVRRAERREHWDGLPDRVNIRVYEYQPGEFTPEAVSLGMGHRYDNAETAARDFARRHGYHLTEGNQ